MEILIIVIVILFIVLNKKNMSPSKKFYSENSTVPAPTLTYSPSPEKLPYRTKYVLTKNEYNFYSTLKPILDTHSYLICPKVGLKDIFEPVGHGKDRMSNFGRISQKHIDFLICDDRLHPLFAIELDDRSHSLPEAKKNDAFKNALFAQSGLPLYRVPSAASYRADYILQYIQLPAIKEFKSETTETHQL